jgi:radical SAM superfamily enzyme YgiQ (UPF0313 family)
MPSIYPELRRSLGAGEACIPAVERDLGNPTWEEAGSRILILRLSPFEDVESSTSHLVLFAECRKAREDAYIDFGFFPDRRDRTVLDSHNAPYYYGIASGRSPRDFDLVLVSNSFALELPNLSYLFSTSGIPSRASARAEEAGGGLPIIVLGGSNAASAGSLLFPGNGDEAASDCLVDAIFFGEGEFALGDIALLGTSGGRSRRERLEDLGKVEGLWVARSGTPATRHCVKPFPPALALYPVLNSSGSSTAKLQISAGCPGYCSFCLEGWESRPYRELPVAEIVEAARELKIHSGASALEIYSYNFNAHAAIFRLIFELNRIFRRVNFMSQRLDILASSPELVEAEIRADKRSFTLGIEGISERMRAYYRKGVSLEDIERAVELVSRPSVRELKLFYILAGFEEEDDIAEFSSFAQGLAERKRRFAPGMRVLVSAGYLVRLPFTPLEYAPLCLDRDRLEAVSRKLEEACTVAGIEFRLAANFESYYVDQILALGGRRLGAWIESAAAKGIMYDGELSRGTGSMLESFALEEGVLDPSFAAEKAEGWRAPLGFADENHEVLYKNYLFASSFRPKEGRLPAPAYPGADESRKLERLMEAKRRFPSAYVRLSFPRELARATPEYRASWLLRKIFASCPESVVALFDAEEALFAKGEVLELFAQRYWGLACYRLVGADDARIRKAAKKAGLEVLTAKPEPVGIEIGLRLPFPFAHEAGEAIKAWLAEERITFIETRRGSFRLLECSGKDVNKRKVFIEAEVRSPASDEGNEFLARLKLGRKARVEPLLSRLGAEARRSSSIEIIRFE